MKKSVRWILIVLSVAVCYGIARGCLHATRGFALSHIQGNAFEGGENTDLPSLEALNQRFYFLGKGKQSFAFVSEDGAYVLKLFNNRYQRRLSLFSFLSHVPGMGSWSQSRSAYYTHKLKKTFESYALASSRMRPQTALVYAHVHTGEDLPHHLVLFDPLHCAHVIDPNAYGFVLQKKATLFYPALMQVIENKGNAKRALASLIALFVWKWKNGIADNDPVVRANYGLIEGAAVQIDVGPLSQREQKVPKEEFAHELCTLTAPVRLWLQQNAPDLLPFLDQELHDQLCCAE